MILVLLCGKRGEALSKIPLLMYIFLKPRIVADLSRKAVYLIPAARRGRPLHGAKFEYVLNAIDTAPREKKIAIFLSFIRRESCVLHIARVQFYQIN